MADYTTVKEEGNKYFNENKYGEAAACYARALSLSSVTGNDKAVLLRNRAACFLKLDKHNEAIADCTAGIYTDFTLYTVHCKFLCGDINQDLVATWSHICMQHKLIVATAAL